MRELAINLPRGIHVLLTHILPLYVLNLPLLQADLYLTLAWSRPLQLLLLDNCPFALSYVPEEDERRSHRVLWCFY